MEFSTLEWMSTDDGIAVVTISRPENLNALNATVVDELDSCFSRMESDSSVRGVVLTGSGVKAFVAGADISQFVALDAASGTEFAERGQAVFSRIEHFPKPVVAAVNGFALGGGCELALACHLRIAAESARFGQPEVSLGILPGYGGSQRLPRLVGKGLATEMILTGQMVSAERAYEIGLVNKVVPPEALLDECLEMIRAIAAKAPLAVALALEALRAADLPLEEGLQQEAKLFGKACATDDFKEGASAFLEKRPAIFSGH